MNLKFITLVAGFAWFACSIVISVQAQEAAPGRAAGSISGRITVDGKPKVGVVVELLATDTNGPRRAVAKTITSSTVSGRINADGGFRIAGIRPGKVSLSCFMAPGDPAVALRLLRIESNGIEWRNGVDVRSGEDISGLRLVLGAGNSVLRGDVKIEGGPLEDVNLYVMYRPTNGDPQRFYRAELDTRRHFVIKGLTPGEYELVIGPMSVEVSGEKGSRMMNRMPTVKQTVTIGAGADADVTLVMTLKP